MKKLSVIKSLIAYEAQQIEYWLTFAEIDSKEEPANAAYIKAATEDDITRELERLWEAGKLTEAEKEKLLKHYIKRLYK